MIILKILTLTISLQLFYQFIYMLMHESTYLYLIGYYNLYSNVILIYVNIGVIAFMFFLQFYSYFKAQSYYQQQAQQIHKMDMQDFIHNQKYKVILPVIYLVNWVLMATGPFIYPIVYQIYTFIWFTYISIKTIFNLVWCIIGCINGLKLLIKVKVKKSIPVQTLNNSNHLEAARNMDQILLNDEEQVRIYHAFIIPSYQEDLSLLQQTLLKISQHKYAKKRYLVYLAMQAHEQRSAIKANTLIEKFEGKFKQMGFSHHTIRQFQQKGKASNVSWCVQNLQKTYFKDLGIHTDQIFITVIDADSWVPEIYIDEVNQHITKYKDSNYSYIYQPCQIFTRNHMQVPFLTRTYDQSHSLVHFCNLVSSFDASFPLSNYTLSYKLIKSIGFWDTCPDAIGQDFHTTLKAFWKTDGMVKTIDVHAPFNQVNIQTGDGYFKDIGARFWQAERHARGCADAAYCINMLIKKKITWRTFIISYNSIQCFILPAFLPWVMLGSTLQGFIYSSSDARPIYLISDIYSNVLFKICSYCFVLSYILYYFFKRKATRELYNLKNEPIWRIIQFPLMIIPNLFLVSFPTFTIAAFKVMLNKNQYEVAKKKLKDNK